MSIATFEGVVENGLVRLPAGVLLPEHQTVFVVVPNVAHPTSQQLPSVRLSDPADAAKFEMKVTF